MDQLVSFSGPWREQDRALVASAIEAFEAGVKVPLSSGTYGSPWLCNSYPSIQHGRLFTASRYQSTTVITAFTAEELAIRIRSHPQSDFRRAS